jgi:glycerophosphoryl diester phosphodiesterase
MLRFFDRPGPLAFARHGFSEEGMENSMLAFSAAVDLGFRYMGTDVQATSDGVAVAFCEESLDGATDGSGRIGELPWSQVQKAWIGGREPISTVAEVLSAWPNLRWSLDVGRSAAVWPTVEAIERTGAHDRVLLAALSGTRRRAVIKRLSRPVAMAGGRRRLARFAADVRVGLSGMARFAVRGIDCFHVSLPEGRMPLVTERTVAAVHAVSVQLHVWSVNDPAEMRRLLDLGVDGLASDRADLLREVLIERGEWE